MSDDLKELNDIVVACIDMDEWKHSWHNPLKTYDNLGEAERNIQKKVETRIDELGKLQGGLAAVKRLMELH